MSTLNGSTQYGASGISSMGLLKSLRLAFTFAAREMRAGVRGFMIFLACLSLGVAAIAGVNALSASLVNSISSEGQSCLLYTSPSPRDS